MAHTAVPDIDFLSGAFWGRNPHDAFTWMRQHSPVHWDGNAWGVATYALLKEVSRTPEVFSNAGGIRPDSPPLPQMIDFDDPEHVKRRKLVNKGFTPRRVRDSEPDVRAACDDIIDAVCEQGSCDFVMDIAAWLPMIMIGDELGVKPADRATLLRWSDDMLRGLTGAEGEATVRAAEAFLGFREYAVGAIAERRANPTDDLLSILVHAEVDGQRLDEDSLVHEALLILIGGDETTRHVISGGMYQLLRNPAEKQRLLDEPALIPTAVEEMLRWVSPIKNMNRTVTRDVELGGQQLHAGDNVLLLYPSANRDESVFDDPFRFDVGRTPNEHVAFGFGTHFCLGNSLARLELVCMVEALLRRLPDLALVDDTEPEHRPANFISGYERMPVTFTPTTPSPRHHHPQPGSPD